MECALADPAKLEPKVDKLCSRISRSRAATDDLGLIFGRSVRTASHTSETHSAAMQRSGIDHVLDCRMSGTAGRAHKIVRRPLVSGPAPASQVEEYSSGFCPSPQTGEEIAVRVVRSFLRPPGR